MSNTLQLNPTEIKLILEALTVVQPVGGGSPVYTLIRKLREHCPLELSVFELENLTRECAINFLGDELYAELRDAGRLPPRLA